MPSKNLSDPILQISSPDPSPAATLVEVPGCLITANGTATIPLASVIAAIGQWSDADLPATPSDPSVGQSVRGFVSGCSSGSDWCFEQRGDDDRRIPGARGCGLDDTLVVWGYETAITPAEILLATPCMATVVFRGVGGCCSGSGKGVDIDIGPPPLFAVAPKFLQLSFDASNAEGQPKLLGDRISGDSLKLTYDPLLGGPNEPVWRNMDKATDEGEWILQVVGADAALQAVLSFRPAMDAKGITTVNWTSKAWSFKGPNVMTASEQPTSGSLVPQVTVCSVTGG